MKTEKKRTLKGSVLFTVVSVLALMIIFMTSALALASSANKRAHKSYSASQASYTARAAIDSILAAVGTDNNFASAVAGISSGGSIPVEVGINEPSLGKITNAKVSYAGTMSIFDPESKMWVEKNVLEITADVTLNGETTTITSRVIQDPVVKSDDGPGYLTMGGRGFTANGGTIMGGTYINMGQGPKESASDPVTHWSTLTDSSYFRYKEGDPKVITLEDHAYWTNDTITHSIQNKYEAPFVINGNYAATVDIGHYYTEKGKGAVIWGNLTYTQAKAISVEYSDSLKAELDKGGYKFTEIPYMFVDGTMDIVPNMTIGVKSDSGYPFNLFAGAINTKEMSGTTGRASIYLMDADKTSTLQLNTNSPFGNWVDSFYSGGESYTKTGGIYSKGSVAFTGNKLEVGGNLRVEKDLSISQDLTVDGDLVVGGTLNITGGTLKVNSGKIYAGNVTGNNIQSHGGGLKAGYTQGNLNYVRAKNITYPAAAGGTAHADYAWLFPTALAAYTTTPAEDGAVDFGDALIDPQYYDASVIFEDDPATPHDKVYKTNVYLNSAGQEVSQAEAVEAGNYWTYNGVTIKNVADFYGDYSYTQTIYPDYATREVLMGVSGPVKGTEGHIALATTTYEGANDLNNRTYNNTNEWYQSNKPANEWSWPDDTLLESGTIKGVWLRNLTIRADGKDVNILVDDSIDFRNGAGFVVDEQNGGHVSFYGTKAASIPGTAGRVKSITKIVTPPTIPSETYATTLTGVTEVKESCTLTGTFNNSVYVKTQGSDVHVLLSDVNFNNSRIYVDETHGGKVYFYFDGKVQCNYDNPSETEQTKLFKTVKELMEDWGIEKNIDKPSPPIEDEKSIIEKHTLTSTPTGNGYEYDSSGDGVLRITGDTRIRNCTISKNAAEGTPKIKTIEVYPPATGSIWVELDDVTIDQSYILIKDVDANGKQKGGTVNFYFDGKIDFATGAYLITESFQNANNNTTQKYQIVSDLTNPALFMDQTQYKLLEAPRVNIYSNKDNLNTEVTGRNDFFITAFVRAPYMTMSVPTIGGTFDNFLQNRLWYDGVKLGSAGSEGWNGGKTCQRMFVLGCLNVADLTSDNDWTLLYVKQPADGGNVIKAADGSHTYAAVSYTDY
ncbi:MAG: hypothetical protein IJM55_06095 [Ruminococcus sp.]|nr:hypothetical protein [Ruminococcus sp.]